MHAMKPHPAFAVLVFALALTACGPNDGDPKPKATISSPNANGGPPSGSTGQIQSAPPTAPSPTATPPAPTPNGQQGEPSRNSGTGGTSSIPRGGAGSGGL